MRRITVYDRRDAFLFELTEREVFGLVRTEEVNGEHSLEITTTRVLEKGWRILTRDGQGKWREHVVYGTDAQHGAGGKPVGTYYCVWSVQHDLMGVQVSVMPGVQTPCTAAQALASLLSATSRWSAGTVTVQGTAGASMYDMSAWEAMSILTGKWGGEVDAAVSVGSSGVVSRTVCLYAAQGSQDASRRFDFGADVNSVRRKVQDGPLFCRISPRGMGEETEDGGYGRKIRITSVNGGKDYLENAAMVDMAKLPDGAGGWEYPTVIAENPECKTPSELLAWSQGVVDDYTVPDITYTVDVVQAAAEGVDAFGVALGDRVHVVDRKFGDGLRLSSRVTRMTVDELQGRNVQVVLGDTTRGLADVVSGMLGSMPGDVSSLLTTVRNMNGGTMSTEDYLSRLIERLNADINATGGYIYITEGQGIRTYDKAVSDPSIGVEADAVVEIKGGTVRIANSRTAQGAWEWKTVFTSGHIAGELVTAAQIVTGYIGSSGGTFIDLDNNTVQLGMLSRRHVIINDGGLDIKSGSDLMGHFGYGYGTNSSDGISLAPYYDMGIRKSGSTVGNYSIAEGYESTASGFCSRASGQSTTASGIYSFASGMNTKASGQCGIAEGSFTTASGSESHACGSNTTASGGNSFTAGDHTEAAYLNQFACGYYNSNANGNLFEVGNGYEGHRSNAFHVNSSGTAYVGSTQVTSDRRVKKPLGGITEAEAVEFVRSLKPSKFEKFGRKELGFYAQDVEDTNLGEYLVDESDDHGYEDFKNLSYDGLIAPLVAYCQHLEKRIEQLEARLDETGGAE